MNRTYQLHPSAMLTAIRLYRSYANAMLWNGPDGYFQRNGKQITKVVDWVHTVIQADYFNNLPRRNSPLGHLLSNGYNAGVHEGLLPFDPSVLRTLVGLHGSFFASQPTLHAINLLQIIYVCYPPSEWQEQLTQNLSNLAKLIEYGTIFRNVETGGPLTPCAEIEPIFG